MKNGGSLARPARTATPLMAMTMPGSLQQTQLDASRMYIYVCINVRKSAWRISAGLDERKTPAHRSLRNRARRAKECAAEISCQGRNRRNSHADQRMHADVYYTSARQA